MFEHIGVVLFNNIHTCDKYKLVNKKVRYLISDRIYFLITNNFIRNEVMDNYFQKNNGQLCSVFTRFLCKYSWDILNIYS